MAIETSCDDTAACLYDGERVVAHMVYRQPVHASVGGVIPEWASREHEVKLPAAVQAVLRQADLSWENLQGVAAAQGPGLIGSLLIGSTFARALSAAWNIPFIGVHHLEAHVASLELNEQPLHYPIIVLVATGGHTHLYRVLHPLHMELLGRTTDDAVGEAFDKVAASLGLPYPGGPEIERLALEGDPLKLSFPFPQTQKPWDFSFSGLKTAFLYARQRYPTISIEDLCASWQHSVSNYLIHKLLRAAEAFQIKRIGLVGGVAANQYLRQALQSQAEGYELYLSPPEYCMDNAAMIAVAAWHRYINGLYSPLTETPFSR
ncbi:MAG: tRNA (adenosine(37)-N6)-threonylcarbamoyltransferase complex transferase subunit TsaD [Bacteroidia bacterium]|nr:tRNA (adenosine(37)-N6)-threonylcarbamoyltransferase complex transferase subunit TsaD [Bacteroidia bacterium]